MNRFRATLNHPGYKWWMKIIDVVAVVALIVYLMFTLA